jgi:hypothetical protein
VKFAGAVAGYNIRFDAYGGSADAGRYHNAGKLIAGQFHDGTIGILGLIPTSPAPRSSRNSPASSTPCRAPAASAGSWCSPG